MSTSLLNKVYSATATAELEGAIGYDKIVASAIKAGILELTDKARTINPKGETTGIEFTQLKTECADYMEYCLPIYCKAVLKQVSDAVKLADDKLSGLDAKAVASRINNANARLPKLSDGTVYGNLDFVMMTTADFKKFEHKERDILAKYRDDKRGILRMNFRRLVLACWNIKPASNTGKSETYIEFVARFSKGFDIEKFGKDMKKRKITPDVLKFVFDLLQDGSLLPESVKQASKEATKQSKQAAKRASK